MKTPAPKTFPAIRAKMGDWWYYLATLTFTDIAERVKQVAEIHESNSLKTWIQRQLKEERQRQISDYLHSQPQRFFNAIVLGIYGGAPDWFPIEYARAESKTGIALEDRVAHAFGLIRLSGTEEIFAIDGQHRVEGIKRALQAPEGSKLNDEEQSVIFVAHKTDETGRQRTRRLFTTLNQYARPVSRGEIIALSEDDTFAIVTRKLIDDYKGLSSEFVPLYGTANIPVRDQRSITSVISLCAVVKAISIPFGSRTPGHLLKGPPKQEDIDNYFVLASEFWDAIQRYVRQVRAVLHSRPQDEVVGKYRHEGGGHFLFRPFCLFAFSRATRVLMDRGMSVTKAVSMLTKAEMNIAKDPWRHIVWNPAKHVMINKNEQLVRNLLLHMVGESTVPRSFPLRKEYQKALGDAESTYSP